MNVSELCSPYHTPPSKITFPPLPVKEELDLTKLIEKCTRLCDDLAQHQTWGTQKETMIDLVSHTAQEILDALVSMHRKPKYKRRRLSSQAKKRIGLTCHSCHTSETPEWRKGPDGARTLCNACGLHYSKLLRRVSFTNASVLNPP